MNNNFKLIKTEFSKITISQKLDSKIIDMTVNKKYQRKIFYRRAIFGIIILFISFICFNSFVKIKLDNTKIKEIDKNNNIKENIVNYDIYMSFKNHEELSWAFNVSNSKLIVEKADYVVMVKTLEIGEGTYQYSMDLKTPIKVETLKILKGTEKINITQILKSGGIVSIEEVIKNEPASKVNKMGLDKLSDKDKKTKYIKYESLGNYDFEVGKIYIVALNVGTDGNLYMKSNGYSVFEQNNDKTGYVNVLTGNELSLN